jgi:hypothetical protein
VSVAALEIINLAQNNRAAQIAQQAITQQQRVVHRLVFCLAQKVSIRLLVRHLALHVQRVRIKRWLENLLAHFVLEVSTPPLLQPKWLVSARVVRVIIQMLERVHVQPVSVAITHQAWDEVHVLHVSVAITPQQQHRKSHARLHVLRGVIRSLDQVLALHVRLGLTNQAPSKWAVRTAQMVSIRWLQDLLRLVFWSALMGTRRRGEGLLYWKSSAYLGRLVKSLVYELL